MEVLGSPALYGFYIMNWFVKFFASGLGTGYIPIAPGTMGTLVGLGFYWVLSPLPHYIYIPTAVAFVFLAVWISARAIPLYGNEDPSTVTIDEIAGVLVTFAFHSFSWIALVAGFVLFRIFDIAKPWPIRLIERRFPGGWGVVLDDVMAGVYANAALWGAMWIWVRL